MKNTARKLSVREIAVVTASGDDDASWLKNSLNEAAKPLIKGIVAKYKQARSQKSRARAKAVRKNVARKDALNDAIDIFIQVDAHTKIICRSIESAIATDTKDIEEAKKIDRDWRRLKLRFPRKTKNGAPYSLSEIQKKIPARKNALFRASRALPHR